MGPNFPTRFKTRSVGPGDHEFASRVARINSSLLHACRACVSFLEVQSALRRHQSRCHPPCHRNLRNRLQTEHQNLAHEQKLKRTVLAKSK
jgi:hypothetical protein